MRQLRIARKTAGLTQAQVAEHIGINQNTYSYWESGKTRIDARSVQRLAELFGVPVDALLDPAPNSKGIKIPVLGRVQAGVPIEAMEEILDYEEITPDMAATGEFFALVIKGNSMEPKMSEGDVVIVRKQSDVTSGDVAVVIVNGHDATVKRVIKKEHGLMLQPTNPAHEPMFFTPEQIQNLPVVVVGRVVELRAKF